MIGESFLLSKIAKTYSYKHIKNLRKAGLLEIFAKEIFSNSEKPKYKGIKKKIHLSEEQKETISTKKN